ncbi:MAG TPA: hypothetical protein VFV58_08785 [Blastocatellia bacterium]|jgi:hypothetical protein|nr:hypothetical protein [Blastocatellia bacterium]
MDSIFLKSPLQRSANFLGFVLVMMSLAIAAPAAERSLSGPSRALRTQELVVTSNLTDQEVEPTFELTFTLNRPLPATEGRLAVLIGQTDISNLLTPTSDNDSLSYLPRILPLPAGESPVKVFLVTPTDEWREITQLTLRVKTPSPAGATQEQPGSQAGAAKTASAKKYNFAPSLTLGMKSQMTESHFPESNRPPRPTFADMTLQASLKSEMTNGWFGNQMQFDLAGSSFQKDALRFSSLGDNAPKVDLSSYLMQFQLSKAKLQVGSVTFGTNRQLINSFGSRGVTLSIPLGKRADFSLAAMNGTSVVGWDNFLGLDRRKHQILSATLGFEFIGERPGGLRLEAGALSGSLQPISGFNQGVINDAEQSKGGSLRLIASDKAQRFKLDAGFTRSLFNNPTDPLLNQNQPVVPVKETTRSARYVDASVALLKDLKLSEKKKANLTLNVHHEQVDPLFRSVAATTQADRLQNAVELTGAVGEITATASYQRFHDNLADIPSLLQTLSQQYTAAVSVPLASLWADGNDGANQSSRSIWLPRLAYNMNRIHQFGRAFPLNAGFNDPSQVPDQISTNHDFNSEWQFTKWRLAYHFNQSFQDNRQVGRALSDLRNQIHGVAIGLSPHTAFDLNFDLNIEDAKNFETARIDRTLRAGLNTNWRMTPRMTINVTASNTLAGDLAGRITRNRSVEFDTQWSYQFTHGETSWQKVKGQFFIRYADRYARTLDLMFGLDNLTRLKTLNGGINFVFF